MKRMRLHWISEPFELEYVLLMIRVLIIRGVSRRSVHVARKAGYSATRIQPPQSLIHSAARYICRREIPVLQEDSSASLYKHNGTLLALCAV